MKPHYNSLPLVPEAPKKVPRFVQNYDLYPQLQLIEQNYKSSPYPEHLGMIEIVGESRKDYYLKCEIIAAKSEHKHLAFIVKHHAMKHSDKEQCRIALRHLSDEIEWLQTEIDKL